MHMQKKKLHKSGHHKSKLQFILNEVQDAANPDLYGATWHITLKTKYSQPIVYAMVSIA